MLTQLSCMASNCLIYIIILVHHEDSSQLGFDEMDRSQLILLDLVCKLQEAYFYTYVHVRICTYIHVCVHTRVSSLPSRHTNIQL